MANKPSRPASLKTDAAPTGGRRTPKLVWLWAGLAAVIVAAAGVAIISAGDDEELAVGSTVPGSVDGVSGQAAEVWPVTLDGTPLVAMPGGDDPAVGTQAPSLSGFTFDGTPVNVDPSKGPVMLVFLAHWCSHCNREIPELLAWRDAGDVPEGLQVIAVTTAVAPDRENYPPSEWIVAKNWTWPVLADSQDNEAAAAFGVSGFPFSVIVGTDGEVLARTSGELGQDGIKAFVDAALG